MLCALPDDRGHLHCLLEPDRRVRRQAPTKDLDVTAALA
mgnify:FL=1